MSFLVDRANSLDVNRPNADRNINVHATTWLWVVMGIFAFSFLGWLIWSFILPGSGKKARHAKNGEQAVIDAPLHGSRDPERIFHYLFTIAAFAGMVGYFAMASDLGNTPIRQYLNHGSNPNQTRQVFYARYCYWFVAWPMVIIATMLVSGVSWATILFAVIMQEFWVVCWLCGALITTRYRWGFFVLGLIAYFVLSAILLHWGRAHARRVGSKHYLPLAGLLVFVWALYSIAWGLSEGGNRLTIPREMIFYGILDLIAVPLYGWIFLTLSRKWDHETMGLHYTQGRVPYEGGLVHRDHVAGGPLHSTGGPLHTTGAPGHHNPVVDQPMQHSNV